MTPNVKISELISAYAPWATSVLAVYCIFSFLIRRGPKSKEIPFIDDRRPFEYLYTNAKERFLQEGENIIRNGLAKFNSFYAITERGPRLILHGKYADELRKYDDHLSHTKSLQEDWLTRIPGFEPFTNGTRHEVTNEMVMKLTRSLPKVTAPVSEETAVALQTYWTDNPDWHEFNLHDTMVQTVAQISTRVFFGPELCRNQEWLRLSTEYPIEAFGAAQSLHQWPPLLHDYIHWFLPTAQKLRARQKQASKILLPVLAKRREQDALAENKGEKADRQFTLLEVIEEFGKRGRGYNPVITQLGFSFASVHSTSDLIGKLILNLSRHPELMGPLRDEIIGVISEDGWQKSGLLKLKLLDSVLKETQRLSPVSSLSIRRQATKDITLSDGTKITKGTTLGVSCDHMLDSNFYPNAETFDGYRFYNLRNEAGQEHKSNLVTPTHDHLGFGFGKHACPGRFFAASEAKVILAHLLLKYDWKLVDEGLPLVQSWATFPSINHQIKIAVRRRKEEIPV